MDARMKADRARLRGAIIAQLSQRQMSLVELAEEVDHIAPTNQVKRELRELIGRDIVCSLETQSGRDVFETWDRAIERVKSRASKRGHSPTVGVRRGEIMA